VTCGLSRTVTFRKWKVTVRDHLYWQVFAASHGRLTATAAGACGAFVREVPGTQRDYHPGRVRAGTLRMTGNPGAARDYALMAC
jgi:hypothetical protein